MKKSKKWGLVSGWQEERTLNKVEHNIKSKPLKIDSKQFKCKVGINRRYTAKMPVIGLKLHENLFSRN